MEKVEKGDERMENRMNRKMGIWFTLMALIAVAFLSGIWAWLTFDELGFGGVFPPNPVLPQLTRNTLFVIYMARTVLSTVNIAILSLLTASYAVLYSKTRSIFTIGLLIFSAVFLMKDVLASPFVLGTLRYIGVTVTLTGLSWIALVEPLLELIALSVLLYLSIEY